MILQEHLHCSNGVALEVGALGAVQLQSICMHVMVHSTSDCTLSWQV
jgi:hypothetical protein